MEGYETKAKENRREVLTLIHRAKTSHIASNFSVIDIATVLYENLRKGDEVVWSKGWAAATIYYFLWKQGKITREQLESFPNAPFYGLAEVGIPGVHVSGGSMGQGLGVAIGMAIGKKRAGEHGTVYCIMSDGEQMEGTTWEGALVASQQKLDNLVVVVDFNKWTAMGRTKEVNDLEPLDKKWEMFNFDTRRINGHNCQQIFDNIDSLEAQVLPVAIIADTIKGKGVSFLEDHLLYHYKHIDDDEYKKAMAELV